MPFEADAGLSGAFEQHPTMTLPRPIRFGTAAYSETTATVVFPRDDPQAW
jgi:hypothetical protein